MRPNLRPVPDAPRRGLGIIRVSKVGDRGDDLMSPDLQRTAINDYVRPRGIRIVDWLEVLDESASQRRSPWWRRLDEAISRVEAGEIDVIVGWKFSRAARNRLNWAVALDRIETAGGTLESATEGVDTTTATGRFTRGMLGEVAAWEAEVRGEGWKEVHAHRLAEGKPHHGKPRWGYRYINKAFEPDPDTADVLATLYRRYIAGQGFGALAAWLNANGYRTSPGYSKAGPGLWSQQTVRRMLDAGFGAGLNKSHGQLLPGSHQPVIDEATWTAYRAARQSRYAPRDRPTEASPYLLSGLARCSCGSPMGGGMFGASGDRPGKPYFRCNAVTSHKAHPGGLVSVTAADRTVVEWMRSLATDIENAGKATALQRSQANRQRRDAERLAREVNKLSAELTRLTRQNLAGIVDDQTYVQTRDQIRAEQAELEAQRLQADADANTPAVPVREKVQGMLDRWPEWDVQLRRGALRQMLRHVKLTSGRPPTIRPCPVWEPCTCWPPNV